MDRRGVQLSILLLPGSRWAYSQLEPDAAWLWRWFPAGRSGALRCGNVAFAEYERERGFHRLSGDR